ncbi:MAG: hypothetical protein H6735_07460 [Alphaproteobacteria bacterium]|nr:hypothetical protein [Alphaproteobacteria bacterium]
MIRSAPLFGLVVLGACAPDLPTSPFGDDPLVLFRDFDGDGTSLAEALGRMDAVMDDLDLDSRSRDRRYDLPALTADDLGGATAASGLGEDEQVRASLVGRSRYGLEDDLRAQVAENQSCSNARAIRCHERTPLDDQEDPDCFVAGTCDAYRTWNRIRLETIVDFWLEAPVDFRRVVLEDGRQAVVARTWLEEPFDNDNGRRTWRQRYGLDVFVEDPAGGTTRRFYATWLGPAVGGFSGALMDNAIRRGLEDGFERPDAWLDAGGTCEVDLSACIAEAPF